MGQTEIPQEIVSARTSDGWELRVFHYLPEGKDVVRFPVILCHGLAANKNSCDFGESGTREWDRYSLAAFLSQQQPDGGPVFDPRKNPERYRWCVDDYIDKDVPAIIQCIQQWHREKKHDVPPVFLVGKSMGGMIAYAYGQTKEGQKNLKGVDRLPGCLWKK